MNDLPRTDEDEPRSEEGSFPRLQGRTQTQLAFVNNLLTTLALAVVGLAAYASTSPSTLKNLGWRRWLLGSALILLTVSLVVGIWLALNRLQALRVSARIARIRQIRDRWKKDHKRYHLDRLRDQSIFFKKWARFSFIAHTERADIRRNGLADTISRPRRTSESDEAKQEEIESAVDELIKKLRTWSDKADKFTWRLIYLQSISFVIAAVLLLIIPMTYYYK